MEKPQSSKLLDRGSNPLTVIPAYINWLDYHSYKVKVAGSSPAVGIVLNLKYMKERKRL